MIALIQRVLRAHVDIDGDTVGAIGPGLLALICAEQGDTRREADLLLDKIGKLRIFSDEAGKMNLDLRAVQGGLLLVSQFTLAADTRRGNRPSFTQAAPPELGRELYEYLLERARQGLPDVAAGRFGADMAVHLVNDGPVTIPLHIPPLQASIPINTKLV
ncbi:D-aminoacyl-tRNA deacylase [Corticimicrobacter populi]|uniref:D-aminoacyl-tRNA deacylase n=1 Tax=Corticimicrobacter populi TaxID=2175229 RepID=A0A2V1JWA0_9BURK|nr:D-aminoacyl-tRNA deacylase [Corticimicrobacter populi]PWF21525.1 D-tyrosyl-tRNA(Tyr) deacylase [Corticimicrobacter populi]